MAIEIRVSQINPQKRHKRKSGDEHPSQQTPLAEIKEYNVLTGLSVHGPEELIGSQHRYFPAINPRVPIGIITVEQDDVPRTGKVGFQRHRIRLAFGDFNLTCRAGAVDGRRVAGVCGQG